MTVKPTTKKPIAMNIDIDRLVKKAQESYSKTEKGLATQLSTGKTIVQSDKDEDYIVWTNGNHWQQLTGLKGLPFGRMVEISGKPDSGKSTHAQGFMKDAQDQGVLVILWDSERKFSRKRFDEKIGGKSDSLLVVNTNKIIDGARAVAHFVNAAKEMNPNIKVLIVWDSVGASLNSTEDDEEDGEDYSKQPGVSAKENSFAVRKFNKLINKHMDKITGQHTISILVVNQTYSNIGSPGQTEKGGAEIYYLSSIIIQLTRKKDLTHVKQGQQYKYGILSRAKVKKNHLSSESESIAELDLVVSAEGIHLAKDVKNFDDIKADSDDGDDE
jgi:recombination protein RecA